MATKAVLDGKVNEQQDKFCSCYALHLSVSKAAEEAGYAREYGYQLLKLPHIIDRIAEIQRNSGVHMVVNQQKVIRETAYLAYSDITDVLQCSSVAQLRELPENVRRAIKRVKVTRTPMRGDGSVDRRSQRTTEGLEAIAENGDVRITEATTHDYIETIEIEMHPKVEPLKLLALITDAIKNPETRDLVNKGAFTGLVVKTISRDEAAKKVTNEQKDDE